MIRHLYDDDLGCIFQHFSKDIHSLGSVVSVNKKFNRIVTDMIVDYKVDYINTILPKLDKIIYSDHKWFSDGDSFYTKYVNRMGCVAFHHSNILVSGKSKISITSFKLLEIPFILRLSQQDILFKSLKNEIVNMENNNGNLNIISEWENAFVRIVLKGYSPFYCCDNIDNISNFADVKYHINWCICEIIIV